MSFQASEAGLRQGEADLIGSLASRQTAFATNRLTTPWNWDGNNPAAAGTGNAGAGVSAQPAYHQARLADVCPIEPGQPCFERFEVTSRGQGGSPNAISVVQSTVLLPPE